MKIYNWLSTKRHLSVTVAIFSLPFFLSMSGGAMALDRATENDYPLKLLGKYLFFDKISLPSRQSCSSCHTPAAGGTNGVSGVNLHQVAVTGARPHDPDSTARGGTNAGGLKPPTNTYATFIPNFAIVPPFGPVAGNFWNGRATGEEVAALNVLGGTLDRYDIYLTAATDQAHASPFINPVEQGLPDIIAVCEHVKSAKYAPLYSIAYDGEQINCTAGRDVEVTFGRIALAIGAYQSSKDISPWDSKRDQALANDSDGVFPLDDFTEQENFGHDLFYGLQSELNPDRKNAGCGLFCHRNGNIGGTTPQERYTGDGYFNIGTPRNVEIPGNPEPDVGVFAMTGDPGDIGHHKAPTLRNVDKRPGKGFVKALTHNGWFKSLESLVHFYNTSAIGRPTANSFGVTRCPDHIKTEKDALANNCWPEPESDVGIIRFVVGNLNLTLEEEAAIVSYMKTFTDSHTAKAPKPFNLQKYNDGESF